MKKKVVIGVVLITIMILGTLNVLGQSTTYQEENSDENSIQIARDEANGLLQRLRNRIRDMLGICSNGCELVQITGTLTYDGTNFYIDNIELHFGPIWYINNAESAVDYDGDGENEVIFEELQGLVGSTVTLDAHFQSDNWMSVFIINGETYRESGQPIWSSQHQIRFRNRNDPKK